MKRFIPIVCLLIIMAVVLFPVAAYASPPTAASGTLENAVSVPGDMRVAGGNIIITETEYAEIHGTMEGDYILEFRAVIHSNGKLNMYGISTIDQCTVNGNTGTIIMSLTGTGVMSSPVSGALQGEWVIIKGTGELANLHGQGTFTVGVGVGGTYSGKIHFDPH